MRSTKLVIGGAAAGAIGVRVARSLYGRWRLLPPADRERIAAFAEDTKEKALSLRGAGDPPPAGGRQWLRVRASGPSRRRDGLRRGHEGLFRTTNARGVQPDARGAGRRDLR